MGKKTRGSVSRALGVFLVVLMAAAVLNVLWQVATRFILRHPSSWTEELSRYLLIWIGLLGASYASSRKMHLAIDVVLQRVKGKARNLAEMAIQTFIFLFALGAMVIGGIRLVVLTLALNQVSSALRIKLGYVYLVLPLSGLLIMYFAFEFFLEKARAMKG
jgi:TRAP-type C4-dicarboxylate transport system permease small subunit